MIIPDFDFDDEIILDDFEEINIPFPQGEPIGSLGTVIFERDENGKMKATTEFDQLSDRITRAADVLKTIQPLIQDYESVMAQYLESPFKYIEELNKSVSALAEKSKEINQALAILEGRE